MVIPATVSDRERHGKMFPIRGHVLFAEHQRICLTRLTKPTIPWTDFVRNLIAFLGDVSRKRKRGLRALAMKNILL